jgi:hypothetical protein
MALTLMQGRKKIFEIVKRYDATEFPEDESSLGFAIDVYQDTINTWNREYLVNFTLLKREMENFGFVLLEDAEATACGFVAGTSLFQELHAQLVLSRREGPDLERACNMTPAERTISFLNRYCIFKKVRSIDTTTPREEKKETKEKIPPRKEADGKKKTNKKLRSLSSPMRVEIRTEEEDEKV